MIQNTASPALPIITVDGDQKDILKKKAEPIKENEWDSVQAIADELFKTLKPLMPAAGLAAPQIGISKAIFIYSYDRQPHNLEVVINPSFESVDDKTHTSWEGCFSVLLSKGTWQLAKIPRYEKIQVHYQNLSGKEMSKILEGFAAKVFQHEYDHLQGIENIERKDAEIKDFKSKDELLQFMQEVKKNDSEKYIIPTDV